MQDLMEFMIVFTALSASSQAVTEQIKRRTHWLDQPCRSPGDENRRQMAVHILAALVGAVLAYFTGVNLFDFVNVKPVWQGWGAPWEAVLNSASAGMLVAYGGPLFDEVLGAVREVKKAKERDGNGVGHNGNAKNGG